MSFHTSLIIDLDMRESGVRWGKRSYMSCELTIYQDKVLPFLNDTLQEMVTELTENLITDVFETDESFNYHRKKK